ncbi:hypothetical protein WOLCODRAFT_153117 [Wolfiporia cocos MD-104 SS10]|uniref:Extracellular membrane protein CFEM domain-containing protein n=1 Tax=Wolfiporia cocos (strain MD-104) TaxID=742152 RepID=A0A2H3JNJ0_WOLCO|nr:hypothetical protein WOLCODRAFT_153117 [Wolfiporia cocos MD-104 SS10]
MRAESFLSFAFLLVVLLASRVSALEISVGGSVGNVTANDFLNITDSQVASDCQTQCAPATKAIDACGTSSSCLCDSATVTAITACEQCMFDALIAGDLPMVDPREGSQTALTAYATACAGVNVTVPATLTTLTLPADWDGPFGQGLGLPATIFTVIIAAALGSGCIYIVSTM